MPQGSRTFAGPNGLIITAQLDHDDQMRPAVSVIGWFADRTKVEVTYSWGDDQFYQGQPVEFWCEAILSLMTAEKAVEIVHSALNIGPSVAVTRRIRP